MGGCAWRGWNLLSNNDKSQKTSAKPCILMRLVCRSELNYIQNMQLRITRSSVLLEREICLAAVCDIHDLSSTRPGDGGER